MNGSVHWGGAEMNAYLTAADFKRRGQNVAILYCEATGKSESHWREIFSELFLIRNDRDNVAKEAAQAQFWKMVKQCTENSSKPQRRWARMIMRARWGERQIHQFNCTSANPHFSEPRPQATPTLTRSAGWPKIHCLWNLY